MNLRRTRRIGLVSAVAVGGLTLALLPVASASAVTVPNWPVSRVPTGCPITNVAETVGGYNLTYTDSSPVTVTGWTFNGSKSRVVLKPGSNPTQLKITVSQQCSGVQGLLPLYRQSINGGAIGSATSLSVEQLSTNAFNAVYGYPGTVTPPTTGYLELPLMGTAPRYDSFVLDQDFGLVSSVAFSGGITFVTGTWSQQRVYLVLATTQATTASRTTVAQGGTVTFGTAVKVAGASAYQAAPGVAVKFQTKLPGKAWVTRATKTTTSTGRASYSFKPSTTMAWRWVLAENISTAPYRAGSISAAKTITVS